MAFNQSLIPVVRTLDKTVLGVLVMGAFVDFVGTETSFTLPSGQVAPIKQFFPDNARDGTNDWYMAYLVDETNFDLQTYLQYPDFESVNSFNTKVIFQSPSTMPNNVRDVFNDLQNILARKSADPVIQSGSAPLSVTPNPIQDIDYNVGSFVPAVPVATSNYPISSIQLRNSNIPPGLKAYISPSRLQIILRGIVDAEGPWSADVVVNTEHGTVTIPMTGEVSPLMSVTPEPQTINLTVGVSAVGTVIGTMQNGTLDAVGSVVGAMPNATAPTQVGNGFEMIGTPDTAGTTEGIITWKDTNGHTFVQHITYVVAAA